MASVPSPPRIVLLAAQLAADAKVDDLATLAARHGTVLRKELLLRIILTYLPETVPTCQYISFLEDLEKGRRPERSDADIDHSTVEHLTDEEAAKKVRKLRLQALARAEFPADVAEVPMASFLWSRAYKVDDETGLLAEIVELLVPFLDLAPCIRTLLVSSVLPLLRRNCEYYPHDPIPHSLSVFQNLPDQVAVDALLSRTGTCENDYAQIGRDLKGLIGPWLYSKKRWTSRICASRQMSFACPGWEQVLRWLMSQATRSWKVAASAVEQWDGPGDVDLGGFGAMCFSDEEQQHLEKSYAQAALASTYLFTEASAQELQGAHAIVAKIAGLIDLDPSPELEMAVAMLRPTTGASLGAVVSSKNATFLRNRLLEEANPLTSPTRASVEFLRALIYSAFLVTKHGSSCSVRRAGELALLQDERDQRAEALKMMHEISSHEARTDDKFWQQTRNEILWLRDWGSEDYQSPEHHVHGVFGQLKREFLEVEMLKALLANSQYSIARSLYEDVPDRPIHQKRLQDTILTAAMNAYNSASNPSRTRGGVKKCHEILQAFPKTVDPSLPAAQRIEALVSATHALSKYSLVLRHGEPFMPIALREHTDPISVIGTILEQNAGSYTRIQELLDLATNMVRAGLTGRDRAGHEALSLEREPEERWMMERRVTALCIDAALEEDDFETAYSYLVNHRASFGARTKDDYLWKAALQAGKYRRAERNTRPTHLGSASASPALRRLEQRLECLATALRIAPPDTLHDILKAFLTTEQELDAAVKADDAQNASDDMMMSHVGPGAMPGAFGGVPVAMTRTHKTATFSATALTNRDQHSEEAPMSLLDLSRASVLSAQRNLAALSSLQRSALGKVTGAVGGSSRSASSASVRDLPLAAPAPHLAGSPRADETRLRKRDQLREAAMGTLVSGVGWLINAPPKDR